MREREVEGRNVGEVKVPPRCAFDVENAQSLSLKYAKFVKIILKKYVQMINGKSAKNKIDFY